ncbi:MAG: hypothetical protein AAGI90_01570 [Chlamydiota bacterium]
MIYNTITSSRLCSYLLQPNYPIEGLLLHRIRSAVSSCLFEGSDSNTNFPKDLEPKRWGFITPLRNVLLFIPILGSCAAFPIDCIVDFFSYLIHPKEVTKRSIQKEERAAILVKNAIDKSIQENSPERLERLLKDHGWRSFPKHLFDDDTLPYRLKTSSLALLPGEGSITLVDYALLQASAKGSWPTIEHLFKSYEDEPFSGYFQEDMSLLQAGIEELIRSERVFILKEILKIYGKKPWERNVPGYNLIHFTLEQAVFTQTSSVLHAVLESYGSLPCPGKSANMRWNLIHYVASCLADAVPYPNSIKLFENFSKKYGHLEWPALPKGMLLDRNGVLSTIDQNTSIHEVLSRAIEQNVRKHFPMEWLLSLKSLIEKVRLKGE